MSKWAAEIAYYQLLGKPIIFYSGIITLLLFLTTATVGYLVFKGHNISINVHKTFAIIAITMAIIHGLLGILIYF